MSIELRGESAVVPLSKVHPNPWNPNRQTEAEHEATRQALVRHGQVAPLVVRWHPEREGELQIIDGEHRLRVLRELPDVEEVLVHNLGHLEDAAAKHLNAVLTEARGANDSQAYGKLLKSLRDDHEMDLEEIAVGLPQDVDTLDDLVHYGEYDWKNEFSGAPEPEPDEAPAGDEDEATDGRTAVFGPYRLPADMAGAVQERLDAMRHTRPHLNEAGAFHAAVTAAPPEEDDA